MMHSRMTETELIGAIEDKRKQAGRVIIAIDGRCASGKTTLALSLGEHFNCNIFHMDDFFLRAEQRTPERLSQPGGNVDYERFFTEVLTPVKAGNSFSYRPFDCHTLSLSSPVFVTPTDISIVEGSYSCHPKLFDSYDLRIFLDVEKQEQLRRIENRNGSEAVAVFRERWIPLEEKYFSYFDIQNRCDCKY